MLRKAYEYSRKLQTLPQSIIFTYHQFTKFLQTDSDIVQTRMHVLQISERFKDCCYRPTTHKYHNNFPLG
jgi:hypothetical protein